MKIEFTRFSDEDIIEWAEFVDRCDEAWVYHTPEMIKSVPYDYSFSIRINGIIEGVCALGRVPRRRGAYLVGPGAALSASARDVQVYRVLRQKLEVLATDANSEGIEFMLSPMAPANTARNFNGTVLDYCRFSNGGRWRRAWELSPGYFSVIDLRLDPRDIRRGFSKGNRANISRCAKLGMKLLVQTGPNATESAWEDFVSIHAVTCARRGDAPYTRERYEHLFQLVKSGHMTLLNGGIDDACVTSILLATYKRHAFYSYGGARDDARKSGAMAWIQNEACIWLKESGYTHYCLGFTISALEGTYEGGVGDFKKRFGGDRWPMLSGELIPRPLRYFVWHVIPDFIHFNVINPLGLKRSVRKSNPTAPFGSELIQSKGSPSSGDDAQL